MEARVGDRVGIWRLAERIGSGGAADVYRAVRIDGEVQHEVAIKIARTARGSVYRESATLRRLSHPNVARWFGSGTTADGCDYVAIEYVPDAKSITGYADQHGLPIHDRLALFLNVCSAVAYLHHHTIVHADLKPENVLIGGAGVVKVIDFGESFDLLVRDSDPITAALTPAYAAPEQLFGDAPAGFAADIYALGAILYELLSGAPPFSPFLAKCEFERQLAEELPAAPSASLFEYKLRRLPNGGFARIAPETIAHMRACRLSEARRLIGGDLDRVSLFALRKEPQRRYRSVEDFASDVGRVLAGRKPAIARSGDPVYSVVRSARRRPLELLGVLAIATALLNGLASWRMFKEATASAVVERQRVDRVIDRTASRLQTEVRPRLVDSGLSDAAATLDEETSKACRGRPRGGWDAFADYLFFRAHRRQ